MKKHYNFFILIMFFSLLVNLYPQIISPKLSRKQKNFIASQTEKLNPKTASSLFFNNYLSSNYEPKFTITSNRAEGGITKTLTEKWENNNWVNFSQTTFDWNTAPNYSSWLWQNWENDNWVNHLKSSTKLDQDNFPLEDVTQKWENNEWINYAKDIFTYNDNHDITELISQEWNDTTKMWVNSMRMTNTYDNYYNLIEDVMEFWEDDKWVGFHKGTHTYNVKNQIITTSSQMWFDTEWMDMSRVTYNYNEKDLCSDELHESWTFVNWGKSSVWTYEYNDNNQEIIRTIEEFEPFNETRTKYSRVNSDYNGNLLIEEVSQEWENENWQNTDKELFTYENDLVTVILWQKWENNEWVNFERWTYSYDNTVNVLTSETVPTKFLLSQNYPNPFNPSTIINYTIPKTSNVRLEVFDLLGRKLLTLLDNIQHPGVYEITFDGSNLSSGTYIYSLQTNNINLSKKCVLIK